jgi:hypothetical protein
MGLIDGIVNNEFYQESKIKILWILREVNHEGDISDWDLTKIIQQIIIKTGIEPGWEKTFGPIVYATYGILNNKLWDEIPYYYDKPEIVNVLKEIAYINVKKTAGISKTNFKELDSAFNDGKESLFKEINNINPEVIIYGGTFYLFEKEIENRIINKNTKHINAYHPSQRSIKQEKYCNQIIEEAIK